MKRLSAIAIVLIGAGCVYIDNETRPDDDAFAKAAYSWVDANIQEMIAVWPSPNMQCGSNTIGEAGCAWWRYRRWEPNHRKANYDYRCEVIARYNDHGVITRIEVKQSFRCDRFFGDDLDKMARPPMNAIDTEVEEVAGGR